MAEPLAERPAMAEYGVPDELDGVLPWAWARQRLEANRNYWVVTASAAGRPHALPVWGVWIDEPAGFWFSCGQRARKLRNIIANPRVTVATDNTVEVVSVEGTATVADDHDQREAMIAAYAAKYSEPDAAAAMAEFVRGHAVVVVRPERAFGIIEDEVQFSAAATRWRWTPVE